jgi:hypothetical protein
LNTLKFAERAKHIVTEVKANKIEAVDAELITKLQKEVLIMEIIFTQSLNRFTISKKF